MDKEFFKEWLDKTEKEVREKVLSTTAGRTSPIQNSETFNKEILLLIRYLVSRGHVNADEVVSFLEIACMEIRAAQISGGRKTFEQVTELIAENATQQRIVLERMFSDNE